MVRHASLLLALLAACTSPVEAASLHYDEEAASHDTRILAIPDGTREPTRTRRAPEVADGQATAAAADVFHRALYRTTGDGTFDEDCVSISSHGFPAIDRTKQFVALSEELWMLETQLVGTTTLRIVALGNRGVADERISIVPAGADPSSDEDCSSLHQKVGNESRRANGVLAARGFRPMDSLAVEYGYAYVHADHYLEMPARERPLQVIVKDGEAIARIPGVKVYERHTLDRDRGSLYAVHGDRETGTVVLTFAACDDEDCTEDPLLTSEVVHWEEETFEALDAHPCTDPNEDDGVCRGTDP